MIDWPPNLPVPPPELVANLVFQLCGNDQHGGVMANKIIAVLIHEVYIKSSDYTLTSASEAFGYCYETYRKAYTKHGERRYVRVLASLIAGEAATEIRVVNAGHEPIRTEGNPYRDACRKALHNHAGSAVHEPQAKRVTNA